MYESLGSGFKDLVASSELKQFYLEGFNHLLYNYLSKAYKTIDLKKFKAVSGIADDQIRAWLIK